MRWKKGSLILCYHRVAEGDDDPFYLCVRPDNFASHLDEIRRFCEPSSLTDLDQPARRPRVVVTLDDGYSDNLSSALPIAEDKGVPITVFVTSGMVDRKTGFWWDRLAALLRLRPMGVDHVHLTRGEERVRVPLGESSFGSDLARLHRLLVPLPVTDIENDLNDMCGQLGVDPSMLSTARSLSRQELLELAASPLVSIGAHTSDHMHLRGRPLDEQSETIGGSKQTLEDILDRDVAHFAYPYGAFDSNSIAAVQSAHFSTACTTDAGTAVPSSDHHQLPRHVVMDWGRGRFCAQLLRWKTA